MRKLMTTTLAVLALGGFSIGIVGCTEESGVESKTELKGPGGTTTVTEKTTVDKSGKNPPVAPGESKAP
jgi:hypothetical protein